MVYRAKSTDAVSQPSHIVASQCTRWRIGSKHPPVRGIIKPMVRGSKMDTDAIFDLKVISLDQYYRNRARALFGRYFRDVSVIDWVDLEDQLDAVAPLTEKEREELSVVDLLARSRRKTDGQEVVLVIEVSWVIVPNDVERAVQRAKILSQRGVVATPVVAGREIDDEAREAARTANCALVMDGRFELDQPLRGA